MLTKLQATISNVLLIYISVEHSRNLVSFIFVWELKIMHSSSSISSISLVLNKRDTPYDSMLCYHDMFW